MNLLWDREPAEVLWDWGYVAVVESGGNESIYQTFSNRKEEGRGNASKLVPQHWKHTVLKIKYH